MTAWIAIISLGMVVASVIISRLAPRVQSPAASAAGVAFVRQPSCISWTSVCDTEIAIWSHNSTNVAQRVAGQPPKVDLALSANGAFLASNYGILDVARSLAIELNGIIPLTHWVSTPVWSPRGFGFAYLTLNQSTESVALAVFVAPLSRPRLFTFAANYVYNPYSRISWSSDARYIAVEAYTERMSGQTEHIFRVDVLTGEIVNLTQREYYAIHPAWSQTRDQIAFVSGGMEGSQIYIMNADGSGLAPLTSVTSTKSFPEWLPDGSAIVYQGWSPEWGEHLGMVDVETGVHRVLYQALDIIAFDISTTDNYFAVIMRDATSVNRLCIGAIDTPHMLTCPAEGEYANTNVQFGG